MAHAHRNELAKKLRALHIPGNPVILTNCYDAATAQAVVAHPATKAIATASFAIAATSGVQDADLTLDVNLTGIRKVAAVADQAGLPLTADMQDGYEDIASNVQKAIEAGAVGANIEDEDHTTRKLRPLDDAVARIRAAVTAAQEAGVPDFCVNARTDALVHGHSIEEAVERGKAFLQAGALTVYVWGGPHGRGVSSEEIKLLVDAFGGMLNVKMNLRPGYLTAKEIGELRVARISIGPELFVKAMTAFKDGLESALMK